MKIFISVPTNGRTDSEIQSMLNEATRDIKGRIGRFDKDISFVLSCTKPAREGAINPAIYQLHCSLDLMADSDIAYFCPGWQNNLDCCVEQAIAVYYGLRCIYG